MAERKEKMSTSTSLGDGKPTPEGFHKVAERRQILSSVLEEHDIVTAQRAKRQSLLQSLEKTSHEGTKAAYISLFLLRDGIN